MIFLLRNLKVNLMVCVVLFMKQNKINYAFNQIIKQKNILIVFTNYKNYNSLLVYNYYYTYICITFMI